MFEAVILFALLGVILLFIVTGERPRGRRKISFIDLSAELKPASKRQYRGITARHRE